MRRFTSLRYDDLAVGALGSASYHLGPEQINRWRALICYPDGDSAPSSFALTWLLDALRVVLDGIPCGGVLTRHELLLKQAPPMSAQIATDVAVAELRERNGRQIVVFSLESSVDETPVVANRMHLLWPSADGHSAVRTKAIPVPDDAGDDGLLQARISQADIDEYAELSNDHNPLHVDSEAGRQSAFGSTIAHGPLPLAFVQRVIEQQAGQAWPRGVCIDARFLGPTHPDDVIEVRRAADDGYLLVDVAGRLLIKVAAGRS